MSTDKTDLNCRYYDNGMCFHEDYSSGRGIRCDPAACTERDVINLREATERIIANSSRKEYFFWRKSSI